MITVIYKLSGNHIIEFSFFGIKFDTSPDKRFLDITILCLLVYHLAHFIWQSIDALKECKLRVTGTNVLFMKNDNRKTSDCDFATYPRQSSLLNWLWKQRHANLISDITQAEKDLKDIRLKLNKNETATTIHQLEEKFNALRQYVVDLNNTVNSKRTLVSLRKFENFCEGFAWSQRWRWYILEFGLPVYKSRLNLTDTIIYPI